MRPTQFLQRTDARDPRAARQRRHADNIYARRATPPRPHCPPRRACSPAVHVAAGVDHRRRRQGGGAHRDQGVRRGLRLSSSSRQAVARQAVKPSRQANVDVPAPAAVGAGRAAAPPVQSRRGRDQSSTSMTTLLDDHKSQPPPAPSPPPARHAPHVSANCSESMYVRRPRQRCVGGPAHSCDLIDPARSPCGPDRIFG